MREAVGVASATKRPPPYLRALELSAGYNRVPIVRQVSIQVGLGEVALVMGPNGAGKSTLIKAITGELPALSGHIELNDRDVTNLREEERNAAGIGYVPQVRDVFAPLTVGENLEMGGYRLTKQQVAKRQQEIFALFPQLSALRRRVARTLSGGERKMLAIGRALMSEPRVMVLDEPTAGLAPAIARSVLQDIVTQLAESGRAVLLIEQRVSLGLEVATWGYVLTDGRLRLQESSAKLRARPDLPTLFLGQGGANIADTAGVSEAHVPGAAGGAR
jgi:ABC-type branched-subunit amino acid transport system ATPase component